MGAIDQAVSEQLARGIAEVVKEEFPLQERLTQARDLRQRGESLQSSAQALAGAQRIVHNAAKYTQKQFKLQSIKSELREAFDSLLTIDPSKITADHGSTEDDELLALAQRLLDNKNGDVQKLKSILSRYLEKYQKAKKAAENEAENLQNNQNMNFNADLLAFMREGYSFLAHLGEEIRATPILYQVTMSFGDGFHRSGIVTLEELMNNTRIEMHRGTYMLRLASTNGLQMSQWSENLETEYKQFKDNEIISQNKWNEGELIEAFQEATTYIYNEQLEQAIGASPENIISLDDHGRHYLIHTKLNLSYTKGPDFFSSLDKIIDSLFVDDIDETRLEILQQASINRGGIDYVAIQAKAQGATFTNLNGLIKSLINAHEALISLSQAKENAQSKVSPNINGLDPIVEKAAEDLVRQFLAI